MIEFFNIREFACKHFYSWETGEDFEWLKKEWHKFQPYLKDTTEAENFILSLAYFYSVFCNESYFLKSMDGTLTIEEFVLAFEVKNPDFVERIYFCYDFTLDILLKVYKHPENVLREFISIAIGFEIPHLDGYVYVKRLFKAKYKRSDIKLIL